MTEYWKDPDWLQARLDDPALRRQQPAVLAMALLDNLKSPDPRLRDELSLTLLHHLIQEDALLPEDRRRVALRAMDRDQLFAGIGGAGNDSVFGRTFSVLVLGYLVQHDRRAQDLGDEVVGQCLTAVRRYALVERDFRGYVAGKGWAHAAAHTADALGALALHPAVSAKGVSEILPAIHRLAGVPFPLGFREDERLALAAFHIMAAGKVPGAVLQEWIESFVLPAEAVEVEPGTLSGANHAHFLRALYFRWLTADRRSPWLSTIEAAVRRFDVLLPYASPPAP